MSSIGTMRLKRDYLKLQHDPIPFITAEPLPTNIFEWHYVIEGPKDSPYYGGYYHGFLKFAQEYPFKAPSIYMITPNGRFQCRSRLCLSISDFHQETWNPSWSVGTILNGLLSFMLEESPTFGSISSSKEARMQFAHDSIEFNLNNKIFTELFPNITEKCRVIKLERENHEKLNECVSQSDSQSTGISPNRNIWLENMGNRNLWNGIFGYPILDKLIFFIAPVIILVSIAILVLRDNTDMIR